MIYLDSFYGAVSGLVEVVRGGSEGLVGMGIFISGF